jgi:thiamine transport system permease protein
MLNKSLRIFAILTIIAGSIIFFILPVLSVFEIGLTNFNFELINQKTLGSLVFNTIFLSFAGAALSLILGLFNANLFFMYRHKNVFIAKVVEIIRECMFVPFVMPTIVVSSIFINLKKELSLSSFQYGNYVLIILAFVFYNNFFFAKNIGEYWSKLDNSSEKVAKSLGASNIKVFFTVTLKKLISVIKPTFLLVFIFCLNSFALVLSIGGTDLKNLESAIYYQTFQAGNLQLGTIYAVVQFLIIISFLFIINLSNSKIKSYNKTESLNISNFKFTISNLLTIIIDILFVLYPIFLFAHKTVTHLPKTFDTAKVLLATYNSLKFSVVSSVIILIISLLIILYFKKALPIFSIIPLAISSVIIGLGYVIFFAAPFGNQNLSILNSQIIPYLAMIISITPISVNLLIPIFSSIDLEKIKVSKSLGKSEENTFFRMCIPLVKQKIVGVFLILITVTFGEFGVMMYITKASTITLPVLIYNYFSQAKADYHATANLLSLILCVIIVTIYLLGKKLSKTKY